MEVAGAGPVHRYRLVGVVRFAGSGSFAGASVAVVTLSQAQAVAGETGRVRADRCRRCERGDPRSTA